MAFFSSLEITLEVEISQDLWLVTCDILVWIIKTAEYPSRIFSAFFYLHVLKTTNKHTTCFVFHIGKKFLGSTPRPSPRYLQAYPFYQQLFPIITPVVGSNKSCIWWQFLDNWITLSFSLGLSQITNEVGTWAGLRGYFQKNWVGVCGTLPETLTLFQTKICDFPYSISDLIKNLIPYFRPAL